jgi:hypothetical protein
MRLLKKIFGCKREKERIETLGKIFPYSRAEDMAKVFELGRIHALRQLKPQVYAGLGTLALVITIGGFYFVPEYLQLKIKDIVQSRVDNELDKRIEEFKKLYSYAKETIPVSVLVLKASNDNREAFYKLYDKSKNMGEPHLRELKELADDAISSIIASLTLNIGPHLSYGQGSTSTKSDHIDREMYRKNRNWTYRVGFLEDILINYQLSEREKFDFIADVLEKDESLRAVEKARQILDEKAKIDKDVRYVDQYIDWLKSNREKFKPAP